MIEIEAGEGYNDGPELRLLVQSNRLGALPGVVEMLTGSQSAIFTRYRPQPSDYRPLLGHHDGYRFNEEWTFPTKEIA